MKIRFGLVMAVVLLLVVAMNGFAGGSSQSSGGKHAITIGVGQPATHTYTLAFERFKAYAEEKSGGRLQISIHHSNQLGNEKEMQEQISVGSIQIMCTGTLVTYEPLLAIYELPYLFENRDQIKKFHQTQAVKDVAKKLESKNILLLGYFENGFRQITNSSRPINSPADVRGLKIRTPENPAQMETFKALGAVVTPMAMNELYGALQQRVVDGQENPLQNIATNKFYEVQQYMAITNHIYNSAYIIVGKKWYEGLPEDLRKIVTDGLKEVETWQMKTCEEIDVRYLGELKAAGMQVTTPNIADFRNAVMPVYQVFINQYGREAQVIIDAAQSVR